MTPNTTHHTHAQCQLTTSANNQPWATQSQTPRGSQRQVPWQSACEWIQGKSTTATATTTTTWYQFLVSCIYCLNIHDQRSRLLQPYIKHVQLSGHVHALQFVSLAKLDTENKRTRSAARDTESAHTAPYSFVCVCVCVGWLRSEDTQRDDCAVCIAARSCDRDRKKWATCLFNISLSVQRTLCDVDDFARAKMRGDTSSRTYKPVLNETTSFTEQHTHTHTHTHCACPKSSLHKTNTGNGAELTTKHTFPVATLPQRQRTLAFTQHNTTKKKNSLDLKLGNLDSDCSRHGGVVLLILWRKCKWARERSEKRSGGFYGTNEAITQNTCCIISQPSPKKKKKPNRSIVFFWTQCAHVTVLWFKHTNFFFRETQSPMPWPHATPSPDIEPATTTIR